MSFNQQQGFTLLEAMLSLLVISGALLALLTGQKTIIEHTNLLAQRSEALNYAESKLEELRNANYASLAIGTASDNYTGSTAVFTRQWRITTGANALSYVSVDVTVNWTDQNNKTQAVGLSTRIGLLDPAAEGTLMRGG